MRMPVNNFVKTFWTVIQNPRQRAQQGGFCTFMGLLIFYRLLFGINLIKAFRLHFIHHRLRGREKLHKNTKL